MGEPASAALSPRASIAMLTLQLRAVQREADDAERAERVWDGDAAAAELRERLDPMVREQRRTFEVELWQARAAASARVEAVREELAARRAVEEAARREDADDRREPGTPDEALDVSVEPELVDTPVVPEIVEAELVDTPVVEPEIVEPDVGELDEPPQSPHVVGGSHDDATGTRGTSGAAWSRPATEPAAPLTADGVRSIVDEAIERFAARHAAPQPSSGMDPEAFSRAFASAFGAAFSAMLDERVAALNAGPPVAPPWVRYAPSAPVEVKKSFWTNMWHADVMLSVLAAVIVLVILIAWST
jgi:hypothetical protein